MHLIQLMPIYIAWRNPSPRQSPMQPTIDKKFMRLHFYKGCLSDHPGKNSNHCFPQVLIQYMWQEARRFLWPKGNTNILIEICSLYKVEYRPDWESSRQYTGQEVFIKVVVTVLLVVRIVDTASINMKYENPKGTHQNPTWVHAVLCTPLIPL